MQVQIWHASMQFVWVCNCKIGGSVAVTKLTLQWHILMILQLQDLLYADAKATCCNIKFGTIQTTCMSAALCLLLSRQIGYHSNNMYVCCCHVKLGIIQTICMSAAVTSNWVSFKQYVCLLLSHQIGYHSNNMYVCSLTSAAVASNWVSFKLSLQSSAGCFSAANICECKKMRGILPFQICICR